MYKINTMKTLDDAVEFHGHICPGLAQGYRVAQKALKELGSRADDEELVAIVENNSCAVDAIQVLTGCTFGKGNLIFRDYGKRVYTFISRPSGDTIRISMHWTPPEDTHKEMEAWRKYKAGDRSEEVTEIVHARKSKKINSLLEAPDDELFSISRDKVQLPPLARLHQSVNCDACGEITMETRVRLFGGKPMCLPCFKDTGEE